MVGKTKERYGLFVGAGISFNSGVPTVPLLIERIVNNLPFKKKDKEIFLSRKYPFEAFIQAIKAIIPIDDLLKVFLLGKPNHAHRFIAKLAKKNKLKLIVTTNFDTLIEQALEKEEVEYEKIFSIKRLERLNITNNKLFVLKIHGSIEDTQNLGIILDRITSKTNILSVRNAINSLFFDKGHSSVVIVGYSCSDHFDIVPELERVSHTTKSTYYFSHVKKRGYYEQHISSIKPFSNYSKGKIIYINTDWFIKQAWTTNFNETYHHYVSSSRWGNIIDNWLSNTALNSGQLNALILCGRLMVFIGHYDLALKYYTQAHRIAMDKTIIEKLAKIASYLGQVYRHLGEYQKAIEWFENSVKYWRRINRDNYAKALSDLGSTYRLAQDYQQATELQKKAIRLFRKTSNSQEEQSCLIILGNIYLNQNKNALALRYYQKADLLTPKVPNKQNEVILLNSLAAVSIKLNKLSIAYDYLQEATKIASGLKIPRIDSAIKYNWGSYYSKRGEFRNALKKYSSSHKISSDTNNVYQLYLTTKGRQEVYESIGQLEKALADVEFCIKSSKENPMFKNDYSELKKVRKRLADKIKKTPPRKHLMK